MAEQGDGERVAVGGWCAAEVGLAGRSPIQRLFPVSLLVVVGRYEGRRREN